MDERKIMEDAVQTMSRYVQFDTTNPPGNEMPAALWLADQLTSRGITSDIRIHEPVAGRGLVAARIASAAQVRTVIANGRRPNILHDTLAGQGVGTTFYSSRESLSQRKRWIAFGRAARGVISVDDGARNALIKQGKSLLAAGITGVEGRFRMGDAVRVADARNRDIARGLVNYSSEEIERIKGCKSAQIAALLGRKDFDEVIHRNNMVVL